LRFLRSNRSTVKYCRASRHRAAPRRRAPRARRACLAVWAARASRRYAFSHARAHPEASWSLPCLARRARTPAPAGPSRATLLRARRQRVAPYRGVNGRAVLAATHCLPCSSFAFIRGCCFFSAHQHAAGVAPTRRSGCSSDGRRPSLSPNPAYKSNPSRP
jgi:hypothetical protein